MERVGAKSDQDIATTRAFEGLDNGDDSLEAPPPHESFSVGLLVIYLLIAHAALSEILRARGVSCF